MMPTACVPRKRPRRRRRNHSIWRASSFQAGNSGILDVIDAERRNAQAQLGFARAKAQRLMDTAELYLALGGSPITPPVSAIPPDPENQSQD